MPARLIVHEEEGLVRTLLQEAPGSHPTILLPPRPFHLPMGPHDLEDLRWYIEDYPLAPRYLRDKRMPGPDARLKTWGEALFTSLFGNEPPGDLRETLAREHTELYLVSGDERFRAMPWELLWQPDCSRPLALNPGGLLRAPRATCPARPCPRADSLRVLAIMAHPSGMGGNPFHTCTREVMDRQDLLGGSLSVDVLERPSFDALDQKLRKARQQGRPYHVLHLDGQAVFGSFAPMPHSAESQGWHDQVVMENDSRDDAPCSPEALAALMNRDSLPLLILSTCRGGPAEGAASWEALVTDRLLDSGLPGVLLMSHRAHPTAMAEAMITLYDRLIRGDTLTSATAFSRLHLFESSSRPAIDAHIRHMDWMVPTLHGQAEISLDIRQSSTGFRPTVPLHDSLRSRRLHGTEPPDASDPLRSSQPRFLGRHSQLLELDWALGSRGAVLLHGKPCIGKTELALRHARMIRQTTSSPEYFLFHRFHSLAASNTMEAAIQHAGRTAFGPDFASLPEDHKLQSMLELLENHRVLWILDDIDSLPPLSGNTESTGEPRRMLASMLEAFRNLHAPKGRLILTSTEPEPWLGQIYRMELQGLDPRSCQELLGPGPGTGLLPSHGDDDLLSGNPLALHLHACTLGRQLGAPSGGDHRVSISHDTPAVPRQKPGNKARLPQEPDKSSMQLQRVVRAAFQSLSDDHQQLLCFLTLLSDTVDPGVLEILSGLDGNPPWVRKLCAIPIADSLQQLREAGFLSPLSPGLYTMLPRLSRRVRALWKLRSGPSFQNEQEQGMLALVRAHAVLGSFLFQRLQKQESAAAALTLLSLEWLSMSRMAAHAISRSWFVEAQSILQALDNFWMQSGAWAEADTWMQRARKTLEAGDGPPPSNTEAGDLWLFLVGAQTGRLMISGQTDAAREQCAMVLELLETGPARENASRLSVVYKQLAWISQRQGRKDDAVSWLEKSRAALQKG